MSHSCSWTPPLSPGLALTGISAQSHHTWHPQGAIHFKEESISLCHPERSEGSLAGQRSFAALRMTVLHRLRLTRKTSSLKCIAPSASHYIHRSSARDVEAYRVGDRGQE